MVGDGSYLMMNSEIATSIAMGLKLTIVLLDNRGFGCINRLQTSRGGEAFNNLLDERSPHIDFAAHARFARAPRRRKSAASASSKQALAKSRSDADHRHRDRHRSGRQSKRGGAWWDVAVPEVSANPNVAKAFSAYRDELGKLTG